MGDFLRGIGMLTYLGSLVVVSVVVWLAVVLGLGLVATAVVLWALQLVAR